MATCSVDLRFLVLVLVFSSGYSRATWPPIDCENGWWGSQCDRKCAQKCSEGKCDRNSGCTQCNSHYVTPNCTDCTNIFYNAGTSPAENCPRCGPGCVDGKCADGNGTCICLPGWQPDTCSDPCDSGLWGYNCSRNCGNCGDGGSCDVLTGQCDSVPCLAGWSGADCLQKLTLDASENSQDLVGPLVGGLMGSGLLVTVAVVVSTIIMRSRRSRASSGRDDSRDKNAPAVSETSLNVIHTEDATKQASTEEIAVPANPYDQLENYENTRDEAKPYSQLQPDQLRTQGHENQYDQLAAQYHNTDDVKPYDALSLPAKVQVKTPEARQTDTPEAEAEGAAKKHVYANTRFKRQK